MQFRTRAVNRVSQVWEWLRRIWMSERGVWDDQMECGTFRSSGACTGGGLRVRCAVRASRLPKMFISSRAAGLRGQLNLASRSGVPAALFFVNGTSQTLAPGRVCGCCAGYGEANFFRKDASCSPRHYSSLFEGAAAQGQRSSTVPFEESHASASVLQGLPLTGHVVILFASCFSIVTQFVGDAIPSHVFSETLFQTH